MSVAGLPVAGNKRRLERRGCFGRVSRSGQANGDLLMTKEQDTHAASGYTSTSDDDGRTTPEAQGSTAAPDQEQSGEGAGEQSHQDLLLTLQDARERADAHWSELLRARAELANQQRRAERDVEHAHKYGLEKFVSELLPVVDSLEL